MYIFYNYYKINICNTFKVSPRSGSIFAEIELSDRQNACPFYILLGSSKFEVLEPLKALNTFK